MDFLCFYFPLFCIHWLMGKKVLFVFYTKNCLLNEMEHTLPMIFNTYI